MPCLDYFCVCYSLKGGSRFIAGLCIVSAAISCIIISAYFGTDFDDIKNEIAENEQMKNELERSKATTQAIAGAVLVLSVAVLVSSGLLLKGIRDSSKKLLTPFLVVLAVTILLSLIAAVFQLDEGPLFLVLTVAVVFIYFFLVVLSFYQTIDEYKYGTGQVEDN